MILYYSNKFKIGLRILFEKKPYSIESVEFVKPGKGKAFTRVKLRNLLSDQLIEKTFRSTDVFVSANIIDIKVIYIYNDSKLWYFMDQTHFNQFSISKFVIQDKYQWLVEGKKYLITLWNNNPISIKINNFVVLKVISDLCSMDVDNIFMTDKKYKLCKLQTGLLIKVPLFIKKGDMIKIDTRTGSYYSRIKI